jgi:hypothetical protein
VLIKLLSDGLAGFWSSIHRVARRTRNPADPPAASLGLVLLMYYLIASWFWPWYLLWALPLAPLVPSGIVRTSERSITLRTLRITVGVSLAGRVCLWLTAPGDDCLVLEATPL